jgi:O-antigen ligase
LIVAAVALVAALVAFAGGTLKERFAAISGEDLNTSLEVSAHGSYEQRASLMTQSLHGIAKYPLLGLGIHNFRSWSGTWSDVHNAYLQMGVEGGIPTLVLFLLIFWQGFANLRRLRRIPELDKETVLYAGALHSALVGFMVGAMFAPEAYHYFPYFSVSYTWVLLAITQEHTRVRREVTAESRVRRRADLYEGRQTSQGAIVAR